MNLTVLSTTVEARVTGPAILRRAMLGGVLACALLVVSASGASATQSAR